MDEIDKILNALETSIRSQDCDYVTKEGISNFIKNTFNPIIKEKFNSLKSQLIEKDKRIEELELPKLEKGDKLKLYGKATIFEELIVQWNEARNQYEIIIKTTGRGDPFFRSLNVIEILTNN